MNNHFFDVIGLDADFNVVQLLKYSNLQWRRRYYESGTFSIQIPVEQYDPAIKYIYTKDRPEVGEISQINYMESNGTKTFALSGYFLEEELNRRICYSYPTYSNIPNKPTWISAKDAAENVAFKFFSTFADFTFDEEDSPIGTLIEHKCKLGINAGTSLGRGKTSEHERCNEKLGDKIYSILKPSEMSFRVEYDFLNNVKTFNCWTGLDRTQGNVEGNNPVVFSTRYGNLKNPNIVWSDSDYKNCYIVSNTYSDTSDTVPADNENIVMTRAASEELSTDTSTRFIYVNASVNRADYENSSYYIAAMHAEAHAALLEHKRTFSFDFDADAGSYEYMQDFDLGDKCSLEVKELGISQDAVLSSIDEVIKNGTWTMTMNFEV